MRGRGVRAVAEEADAVREICRCGGVVVDGPAEGRVGPLGGLVRFLFLFTEIRERG